MSGHSTGQEASDRRLRNSVNRIIAILVLSVAVLLMLGTVMLYSSTTIQPNLSRLHQHLWWMGFGIVSCVLTSLVNYSRFRKFHAPRWLFALAILLLLAVFVPGI